MKEVVGKWEKIPELQEGLINTEKRFINKIKWFINNENILIILKGDW